jgi:glyoxylase-like metal-dependent hydrolase (beta-lactamase superfamily II)
MKARIDPWGDHLFRITLEPPLAGFEDFIAVWLSPGPPAFLVDVGPASTAGQLIGALERLGVARLEYILLTHIHLDHAGAAGSLAARFPEAAVVCHDAAVPHLADPGRLWEGSRKVLGPVAAGYGAPAPVALSRLRAAQDFATPGIEAIPTPGHAPHHVSYDTPAGLFAGEACGVWYDFGGGAEYLRPATPPQFFLRTALASIDALLSRDPGRMVVGHLGATGDGRRLLARHRGQLAFWEAWLRRHAGPASNAEAVSRCADGLLAEDPLLAAFDRFPPATRDRERYFMSNSVNGFLGWLRNSESGEGKAE